MDKKKLLKEYNELVNTLVEKTKFIYSDKFFSLEESEKQKYVKDKMATEGHLSTLSNILFCKTSQNVGLGDFFALGLISSMFGNGFGFNPPVSDVEKIRKELEKAEVNEEGAK